MIDLSFSFVLLHSVFTDNAFFYLFIHFVFFFKLFFVINDNVFLPVLKYNKWLAFINKFSQLNFFVQILIFANWSFCRCFNPKIRCNFKLHSVNQLTGISRWSSICRQLINGPSMSNPGAFRQLPSSLLT